jgi:excisionase family DNA binding protein
MSEEVLKRLYSAKQAGRYMGVSEWTIRHLNWSGKLPCVRQGRRVLFDVFDLNQYIENNKQEGRHGNDLSPQEA